jgi:hypothetical protein
MYRCANDTFGYCTGEPEWKERPSEVIKRDDHPDETMLLGGACKLDPKTCGKHQTNSEHTPPAELPKNSYRHRAKAGKK